MPIVSALLRALGSLVIQAIGFSFMTYYWLLTVKSGAFFKKPSAEYKSELALGMYAPFNA
jgi:hypothetical protein